MNYQLCKQIGLGRLSERLRGQPSRGTFVRNGVHTRNGRVRVHIVAQAKKGFGASKAPKKKKIAASKGAKKGAKLKPEDGWFRACTVEDFPEGKTTKAVVLGTGKTLVVYKAGDAYYSSEATSTAYQFPLVDAKVYEGEDGPAIECPLDGTTYDLQTGKVIDWCPSSNPLRSVLGALKSNVDPINLPVYEVAQVEGGELYVRLPNA